MPIYADLYRYRELFGNLFRRDLQTRYKGSVLGVAWSLVNPLVLMGIYVLVFSVLWKVTRVPHYALYLLVGLTVWLFVSSSLTMAARSLVDSAALVKRVRFPRQLVPFSVVATQLVTFAAMLVVLIVVNAIVIPETRDTFLVSIPLALVVVAFVCGIALAVACANVLFRDVEHLVTAALLPWFFLTPILYRLEDLPGGVKRYHFVVEILRWGNPLTPPIYALRDPLFYGRLPHAWDVVYLCAAALIALAPRGVRLQPRRRSDRSRALKRGGTQGPPASGRGGRCTALRSSPPPQARRDPGVVDPRLVALRAPGGEAGDRAVRGEGEQQRRTDERLGERRVATAPRSVRAQRAVTTPVERPPDRRVALGVGGAGELVPVRCGLDSGGEVGDPAARVAGADLDVDLEHGVADLGQPVAVLEYEVEGEAIRAGRDHGPHGEVDGGAPARRKQADRGPASVPVDRVAQVVEPVIGGEDLGPPRRAGVLELDAGAADRPRLRRLQLVPEPADAERPGGDGVGGNRLHRGLVYGRVGAASRPRAAA